MSIKPKVDIFFLADATGSMYNCIKDVKSNMTGTFVETRKYAHCDFDMGLGFYRDIDVEGPDQEYGILQKITNDSNSLQRAINNLQVMGGGDAAESQVYALTQIAQNGRDIGWRKGATRIIVWFGDIYGHSAQVQDGVTYTVEKANNALYDANIAVLAFSMRPTNMLNDTKGGRYVAACQIIDETGGSVTLDVDQDDAVNVIFDYIKEYVPGFEKVIV
jgi:hypothetical protein